MSELEGYNQFRDRGYSVRWATGSEEGHVLTYTRDVEWDEIGKVVRP